MPSPTYQQNKSIYRNGTPIIPRNFVNSVEIIRGNMTHGNEFKSFS